MKYMGSLMIKDIVQIIMKGARWILMRLQISELSTYILMGLFITAGLIFHVQPSDSSSLPGKKSAEEYNIILISATNIGARHLGTYGYKRNTSPHIDALAKDSIVFENFFTHASWTLPTGMSLFSSLYPYHHQVMNRIARRGNTPIEVLSPNIVTLVDLLKKGGYSTGAFTGGFDYRPEFGLTDRFDFNFDGKDKNPVRNLIDINYLRGRRFGSMAEVIPEALNWIEENRTKKFFLFLQGYDTHCPFDPKEQYDRLFFDSSMENTKVQPKHCYRGYSNDGKYVSYTYTIDAKAGRRVFSEVNLSEKDIDYLEAQYDAEIRYVDDQLGSFINALKKKGIFDKTIIIFLSEHGEMFAKHGRFGRAGTIRGTLYDDVIHIPLIVKHPDLEPKRIEGLSQLIDVMPTLLDLTGISIPASLQGKSLLPLLQQGKAVNEEIYGGSVYGKKEFKIYGERTLNEYIRGKEYKLIHEVILSSEGIKVENYELFHVSKDREEENNLFDSHKEIADQLKRKLGEWSEEIDYSTQWLKQ